MRDVSLKAGCAAGYVQSLLTEGKDPTIDRLIRVCNALGVSLSWLIYGVELTPAREEIVGLLQDNPGMESGILQVLRSKARP